MAELVPQSLYSQWEARKKEKLLLKLPGLQYCPRCDPASADFKNRNGRSTAKLSLCSFFSAGGCAKGNDCRFAHGEGELAPTPTAVPCLPVSDGSGDDTLCICPECRYTFCAACHDAYHPGVECVSSAAREEYLRTREKLLREQGGTGGEAQERLLAARAKLEELKSLDAIRQMSKPCPSCGMAISKTEGCNHMQCRFCSCHFCWSCLKVIADSNPYDHFKAGGCTIFPDQAVPGRPQQIVVTAAQRREDRLARQQLRLALRDVEAEVGRVERRCPFCSHRNFRGADNSNHHRCERCGGAFCFLCAADLRRGVRGHFRPGSHPQHSVLTELRQAQPPWWPT